MDKIIKKKICPVILLILLIIFSLSSGCSVSKNKTNQERIFCGAPGIWLPPPQGHFNGFLTNPIGLGVYTELVEQPLAIYNWGEDKWVPILAVKWNLDTVNNLYTVHLRQGVRWHDGREFTAADVVDTFTVYYLMNLTLWSKRYIDQCYARDKYTVVFHIKNPSIVYERFILRTTIKPRSIYGKIAQRIRTWMDYHMYLSDYDNLVKEMEKYYQGVRDAQKSDRPSPKLYIRNRNDIEYLLAKRPDSYKFLNSLKAMFDESEKIVSLGKPLPEDLIRKNLRAITLSKENMKDDLRKIREFTIPAIDMLNNTKPEMRVGTGPFTLEMKDVNEAQIVLRRFDQYWDSGNIYFDKIVLYNGETPTITPMLLAHEVDYATHGFPVATQRQLLKEGYRIIYPMTYGGVGLGFNFRPESYPLNRKDVRQALAYLINRKEVAYVTLGEAAKPQIYMVGFGDRIVPKWVHPDVLAKLNTYDYNPEKAVEMFNQAGFKKGPDGFWIDDRGKRMVFSFLVVLEYADHASAAENITLQLRKFGLDVKMKAITAPQWAEELNQGRYDMAIRIWGGGNLHPYFQFQNNLLMYNYPTKAGPGMNFPMIQVVEPYGKVDLEELIQLSSEGFDKETQMKNIDILSLGVNDLLPMIPIYERYGNNPVLEGVRIQPLPKESPYYLNSVYLDNFLALMMLDGTLRSINLSPDLSGGK